MAGAAAGKEKRKLTTVEQDLLPIEELVDASQKSTVGRDECITARLNLPYIVRFGPYRPHCFVPGDTSPLLSLTPQNVYDKLATNTLNKVSYHSLTRRCGILQVPVGACSLLDLLESLELFHCCWIELVHD
jgi:hypothetical protein